MAEILTAGQARARGQYDEQLQRQLQEKKLLRALGTRNAAPPAFFTTGEKDSAQA